MSENNSVDINNPQIPLSKQEVALYIVATPIGNMDDITLRAIKVLKNVDLIACEDTRVTGKLLSHIDCRTKTTCYNDHSNQRQRDKIISIVQSGQSVALVSDAGTPLISDPGYKLVKEAKDAGVKVIPIPGCSSVITALCASGLPTDSFLFEGFLPPKTKARQNHLEKLKGINSSLVFFESARRLTDSLADIEKTLPGREICIARELTKKFEEITTSYSNNLMQRYNEKHAKGEVVIIISPPNSAEQYSDEEIKQQLTQALKNMSLKDAVAFVAENTGSNKKDVYKLALEIK